MSVVSRSAWRRWAVVLAAPSLAGAAVGVASGAAGRAVMPAPDVLLRRVLGSASVAHQGLAESRGMLGLPDVRRRRSPA